MSKISDIQVILGFTGVQVDGIWGPKSQRALDLLVKGNVLVGDGTWGFLNVRVDGDDILIEDALVTAFGGANDSGDSGETASGYSTRLHPEVLGCALPMRRDGSPVYVLRGSPVPKVPWFTTVIFTDPLTKLSVTTKLVDEGPAKRTKHGGDLTVAAAKVFDKKATANNFTKRLNIRIVGGAHYATF